MTNDKKVMLDVRDVMAITGLGRNNAYELMKSGEFHVKTIGKKYLVHEEVFQNWLKGNSKTKKDGDIMKGRKNLVTEDTVINVDESVLKIKAEELLCELFVDYVNEKYGYNVLEIKEG